MFAAVAGGLHQPATSLSNALPVALREPLTFVVLLVGAGCCAGVVGLVVGLPTLRLRGDYLAIATLGLSEIIRIIIQNSPPLGGALGLTNIPRYTNFAWLWGVAILSIVLVWRLAYSARGRQIIATREDEIAASAVGIGTTRQKVLAFVVGAFLGGVAGALFAMQERSITPGYFNIQKSIEIVVIVTLGGLGSISGAILAAIVLTLLPELLRTSPSAWPIGFAIVAAVWVIDLAIRNRDFAPGSVRGLLGRFAPAHPSPGARVKWMSYPALWAIGALVLWELMRWTGRRYGFAMSDFRMIIYSLLLVFMMLVRPQGLLGGRELWPRRKPAPLRARDRQPAGRGFEVISAIDRPPTLDKPATQARGDTKEREGLP
jgi:ABC-type branched-subunit amino acid transport system permease subunit